MPSLYWSLKLKPYLNPQIENGPLFVISRICFLNGYLDMWGCGVDNFSISMLSENSKQPVGLVQRYYLSFGCCNKFYLEK